MNINNTTSIIDYENIEISSMKFLDQIIVNLKNSPIILNKVVKLSIIERKNSWILAWILSKYVEHYKYNLDDYADIFVNNIHNIKKDGHIRQLLIILRHIKLDEKQSSNIYDYCFLLFTNNKMQSSVRANAFKFMWQFAKSYYELETELKLMYYRFNDNLSAGIRHSIDKEIQNRNINNF